MLNRWHRSQGLTDRAGNGSFFIANSPVEQPVVKPTTPRTLPNWSDEFIKIHYETHAHRPRRYNEDDHHIGIRKCQSFTQRYLIVCSCCRCTLALELDWTTFRDLCAATLRTSGWAKESNFTFPFGTWKSGQSAAGWMPHAAGIKKWNNMHLNSDPHEFNRRFINCMCVFPMVFHITEALPARTQTLM